VYLGPPPQIIHTDVYLQLQRPDGGEPERNFRKIVRQYREIGWRTLSTRRRRSRGSTTFVMCSPFRRCTPHTPGSNRCPSAQLVGTPSTVPSSPSRTPFVLCVCCVFAYLRRARFRPRAIPLVSAKARFRMPRVCWTLVVTRGAFSLHVPTRGQLSCVRSGLCSAPMTFCS
jgi:hypothetical protein